MIETKQTMFVICCFKFTKLEKLKTDLAVQSKSTVPIPKGNFG